jgi:hypothetical protein
VIIVGTRPRPPVPVLPSRRSRLRSRSSRNSCKTGCARTTCTGVKIIRTGNIKAEQGRPPPEKLRCTGGVCNRSVRDATTCQRRWRLSGHRVRPSYRHQVAGGNVLLLASLIGSYMIAELPERSSIEVSFFGMRYVVHANFGGCYVGLFAAGLHRSLPISFTTPSRRARRSRRPRGRPACRTRYRARRAGGRPRPRSPMAANCG